MELLLWCRRNALEPPPPEPQTSRLTAWWQHILGVVKSLGATDEVLPTDPSWLRWLAILGVGSVLVAVAWAPMLLSSPMTPTSDGEYSYYQFEIARAILLDNGELPLWNQYDCRGVPNWDHPEVMTNSPLFILTLPLNTLTQYHFWMLIHCLMGFVGMWLLARKDVGLPRLGGLVASSCWALAVAHTSHPPVQEVVRSERFHYGGAGLTSRFINQPRQNRAWLGCRSYEWIFHHRAGLWSGDDLHPGSRGQQAFASAAQQRLRPGLANEHRDYRRGSAPPRGRPAGGIP